MKTGYKYLIIGISAIFCSIVFYCLWSNYNQNMTVSSNDISIKMKLTLEEMYSGVSKEVKYERNSSCLSCDKSKDCSICFGRGIMLNEVKEEIKIPEGVGSDMVLNFKKKGHLYYEKKKIWDLFSNTKSKSDRRYGSLIIHVEEIKHDIFSREGTDLIYQCRIKKSALEETDKKIEIQYLDNEIIKLLIPKSIIDGQILRIQGKGFKDIRENKKGNLLIVVNVINE